MDLDEAQAPSESRPRVGARSANGRWNGRSSALAHEENCAVCDRYALAAFVAVILVGTGSRSGEVIAAGLLVSLLVARSIWCRGGGFRRGRRPHRRCSISRSSRSCVMPRAPTRRSSPRSSVLPVFWFALYGTRTQLLVSLAALFVTLAAPALIAGAPDYPLRAELVRAFLWLIIAGGVGLTVHRLVLEARARFVEYRSVLETGHESFISAEPGGRIADWNQQAERDFGWSRDEVMGRDLAETLIPPRFRDAYREGFDALLRTGQHGRLGRRFEMPALRRDGTEFPVEITVSAMRLRRWLQAQRVPSRHLRAPRGGPRASGGRGAVPARLRRQRERDGDRQPGG